MQVATLMKSLESRESVPLCPHKIYRPELSKDIHFLSIQPLAKAALYLWNDDLDKAHKIAQDNEGPDGNLIHATMHRREGDYSNSKYWLGRCENHPVFSKINQQYKGWDPYEFVDSCEQASHQESGAVTMPLEAIQLYELKTITKHCL